MDLIILAIAIFLVGTVFILGTLYLILSPSKNRALRTRLQAIHVPDGADASSTGTSLLRQDILSQIPAFDRFLARIPAAAKLNLFIQQAGMDMPVGRLLAIIILIYTAINIVLLIIFSYYLYTYNYINYYLLIDFSVNINSALSHSK